MSRGGKVLVVGFVAALLAGGCTGATPGAPVSWGDEYCADLVGLPCPRQVALATIPVAGAEFSLVYASDRVPGRTVAGAPDARPLGLAGWGLDVLHSYDPQGRRLALGDGTRRHVDATEVDGGVAIPSVDAGEIYVFDHDGRHLRTEDGLTGAVRYRFRWGKAGLVTVTGPGRRVTTIHRDGDGKPASIVTAAGYRTRLGVRGGWLAAVAGPDGRLTTLTSTRTGLLQSLTDATAATTRWSYDEQGRLIGQVSPTGARTTYGRVDTASGFEVRTTTAAGRRFVDTVGFGDSETTQVHRDPAGVVTSVRAGADERTLTRPDGTKVRMALAPDRRWGMAAPVIAEATVATTDGETRTASETRDQGTRTYTVDGAQWTQKYDPAKRTTTITDPARQVRRLTHDQAGRLVREQSSGEAATSYRYTQGRLVSVSRGDRTWRYSADPKTGGVVMTDPLGRRTRTEYDRAGLAIAVTTPDGATVRTERDVIGRVTAAGPPGRRPTLTSYRPDGLVETSTAPAGRGPMRFTGYEYTADGALAGVSAADGGGVSYGRDKAGRVTSVDAGTDPWQIGYDGDGLPARYSGPGAQLARSYADGALVGETWSGSGVEIDVRHAVEPLGKTISLTVGGKDEQTYEYDSAGRVTKVGDLHIDYDEAGRVGQERLGDLTRTFEYNTVGERIETTVHTGSKVVYRLQLTRDRLGRVVRRAETVTGLTRTVSFRYDKAGRLASAGEATYRYDRAGNLVTETRPDGTRITSRYDGRDALVSRGKDRYTYDADGRLTKSGGTTYRYDRLGNLLGVTPKSGPEITYDVDGLGRRIVKKVGGKLVQGLVYQDALRPVAEFDADGEVVARFGYGPSSHAPSFLARGGKTYLVAADDAGTPRAVIDAATGKVAEHLDTDPWGRTDRPSKLLPIGLAGGISDPDTGLVRFGARDYDPASTRWTAPDPLGAASGDPNLYRYALAEPVNTVDRNGLEPTAPPIKNYGLQGSLCLWGRCWSEEIGAVTTPGASGAYHSSGDGGGFGSTGLSTKFVWGETRELTPSETASDRLGNFGGLGMSEDVGFGPVGGGAHQGFDDSGRQTTEGSHAGLGPGAGLSGGGSITKTDVFCFTCPFDDLTGPETDPPDDGKSREEICSSPNVICEPPPSEEKSERFTPTGGKSIFDPHLVTEAGAEIDFQAAGEFTALRSDSGDLIIQVRQEPADEHTPARLTFNTAVAAGVHGDRVMFERQDNGEQVIRVNGKPVQITDRLDLPNGGSVVADGIFWLVIWPDGSILQIGIGRAVNLALQLPDQLTGKVHGLLGPKTGKQEQVAETRDGKRLTQEQLKDYQTRYRTFGDSWRITQQESLFDYAPGESTKTFDDRSTPDPNPPAIDEQQLKAAELVCESSNVPEENREACIADVARSGDASLATEASSFLAGFRPSLATAGAIAGTDDPPGKSGPQSSTPPENAPPGRIIKGSIDAAKQRKSFTVNGHQDDVVYIRSRNDCDTSDLYWNITRPDDSGIGGIPDICKDIGRVKFDADGAHTIHVHALDGTATGPFEFEILTSTRDEVRNAAPGQRVTGSIDRPGAKDVYRLTARAGQKIRLTPAPGCADGQFLAGVQRPDGSGIGGYTDLCADVPVTFDTGGVHLLEVWGVLDSTGSYALTVEEAR